MKLFLTDQIRKLDKKTMEREKITSSELMLRASLAIFNRIIKIVEPTAKGLVIVGPGNNGGDALVVARLLHEAGFQINTALCNLNTFSSDASIQLGRLQETPNASIFCINQPKDLTSLESPDYILDGLFGSGLNRPLVGFYAEIVHWINSQNAKILSIDVPSGLFGENNTENIAANIVRSNLVFGLQFPRICYFLAENEPFIENWELVDIAINSHVIEEMATSYYYSEYSEMKNLLKKRSKFSHKGTFGKGLLIAGSPTMMGAAILSAKGALRSGIGLLTVRVPSTNSSVLQNTVPEALVHSTDSEPTAAISSYTAVAMGPGIGIGKTQALALENLLKQKLEKLILDADALNLLSENQQLFDLLPINCILTPHPKEFDRLVGGSSKSDYERLDKAIQFACAHRVYVVLKGAYTACITPEGICRFNSTGNSGMSTGGSGDVLTGIILSLLAQGYDPEVACKLGVYLHGLSGDLALEKQSQESLLAGDLVEFLGKAFQKLHLE